MKALNFSSVVDPHGHGIGGHAAHGPESSPVAQNTSKPDIQEKERDLEHNDSEPDVHLVEDNVPDSPLAQVIGIAILEFGVLLHR
jgi:solute carrier family 39 (zinc transporter), member 1/2/3